MQAHTHTIQYVCGLHEEDKNCIIESITKECYYCSHTYCHGLYLYSAHCPVPGLLCRRQLPTTVEHIATVYEPVGAHDGIPGSM